MRNLFTQLFKQLVSVNQTNNTQSRDYRNGVMSWLSAGHLLCATPNWGTTPPIHHTPYTIHRSLRLAAMVTLLLTLACGNVWGDDYTETYSNPTGTNTAARANGMGAFTTIGDVTGNVSFGNSSLQISTNAGSGTFTISSTDGSYIKEIRFTQNSSYPVNTLTSSDGTVTGPSTNVFTFTPSTSTKTSCSFSLSAQSGKKVRIAPIAVDLTSDYEYFSKNFSISSGTVSCTKSNGSSDVTITSTGGTSNNGLTLANTKVLTIASVGHNIKKVNFTCESHNTMSNLSANTGTYSSNSWTAGSDTKTVTFTSSGSNATIVGISVELEAIAASSTWYVKGGWNSWGTTDNLTGSGTELSATVNITTAGLYEFKIWNSDGDAWYGNTGNIGCNVSGWVFSSGESSNCKFFASETGNYTFTFDTDSKELSVTYPTAQGKYYFKNSGSWGAVYVYRYKSSINNGWPGTQVVETETVCGDTYYFTYADPGTTLIFDNNNDKQTGNMTASGNAGKYVENTGNTWTSFPTYTVTYNGNTNTGGSVPTDASSPYACGSTVTVKGNTGSLAKSGYTFNGWNTAANGSGTAYAADATFTISANTTLYAQWTPIVYTVTYNVNGGGSVDPTSATQATPGASVTLPTPTWSGYTFDGWYNAGTKIGNAGASYTPTADITLYAHWTDNIDGKVFSFIDNNYGDKFKDFKDGNWVTADATGKSKTYTNGTTGVQYVITSGAWDKKNNAISALAKFKNGSTAMSVVIPTGKIATVKISYGAYNTSNRLTVGGSNQTALSNAIADGNTNAQVYNNLKEITLSNQQGTLTLGSSTGNIYIGRVSAVITGYTITYDKGTYGTGTLAGGTKTAGSSFTLSSSSTAFSRDGYTYDGWSTNADGSTLDYAFGASYITDAALTLYPHWVACTAPSALTAGSTTAKGTTFTVTDGDDTNNYEFYVSTSSSAPNAETSATYTSTSKTKVISDLYAGTTFYAWVRSVCDASHKSPWTALTGSSFTTSTVSVTHTLTNVTKTSGATTAGGSDYTAVYAADAGYSLSAPAVTIDGNAADSGTDYTWTQGTGTLVIPANKITGNIVVTITSPAAAPTQVDITGGYHYYPGETISLTATATGGNGPKTYQWYKGGKADGNAIDGATSATFSKTCVAGDAGAYYCKVTCGGSASTWSDGAGHNAFYVKVMQFVLKNSSGVTISTTPLSKVDATHATIILNLTGGTTYKFRITDGCGNYFGYSTTITSVNCTDIYMSQDADCSMTTSVKTTNYTFNVDLTGGLGTGMKVDVVYPGGDQAADKVIYWDNSVLNWDDGDQWYRIGRSNHHNKIQMTKVYGTANLYKVTTAEYNTFEYWHIANNEGEGTGNLFWTKYSSDATKEITHAMAFEGAPVTLEAITVTPTTSHATGETSDNDNCEFYTYTTTPNMKTQNVSITAPTNGTITVSYTDVNNAAQSFTSGSQTLAHTVIITPTATPATGYELSSLTVNGAVHTSGNTYTVTGTTVVAATFSLIDYTVTLNTNGGTINAGNVTSYNYGTGATLPTNVTRTGYTFGGWFNNSGLTGDAVTTISSSATGNKEFWAKWIIEQYDVTATLNHTTKASGTTGSNAATYNTEYTATFTADAGYVLPSDVTVTIGGVAQTKGTGYTWSVAAGVGTFTVPAAKVTGAIAVTITSTVDCPASASGATVYKFVTKSSGLGTSAICTNKDQDYSLTTSDALTTLTGGTLTARASSAGTTNLVYNTSNIKFTGGTAGWLILGLNCSIQSGDIIRYINSNSGSVAIQTAKGTTTNQITLAGNSKTTIQQVVITSDQATAFSGLTTVYMVRTSNTSEISYFEIIRPYVVTLDANTNGGKVGGNNTATMYFKADEAQALPHATKTGYLHTGWFAASSGGVAVSNPYTPTATTTLYAQFSDCPSSGTVYKFQVATGLTNGNLTEGDVNVGNYLSILTGGSLTAHQNSSKLQIVNNSKIEFGDNNVYLKIDLDCALQAGDQFKTTISTGSSGDKICYTTSSTRSTTNNLTDGTDVITTIPAGLVGAKTIYLWRNGSSPKISYFEIIRPACTNIGISTQPTASTNANVGSAANITGLVASGTNPMYQWYTCNSDGSSATAINASGAMSFTGYTTATLGLTPTAAGTTYYKCVVSGDCGDPVTSNVVSIVAKNTISPSLSYSSEVVAGETLSPTLTGNTGSGAVTYSLNSVTPAGSLTINSSTGVVTGVTAGGTATVTATIAASGDYWGNTATSGTITVLANPLGAHTLTWNLNVNTSESSIGTASKASTTSYISNTTGMTNLANYGSLSISSSAKADLTSKIQAPTSYTEGKYMYVTFTVPSGYQFTPSSVSVKVQPVSAAGDVKLVLSDAGGHSINKTQSNCSSGSITTVTMTNGSSIVFYGTVTLKIYCYGSSTGTYRLGSPITIDGTLAEVSGYIVTYADGGATSGSVPVDASSPYAEGADVTVLGNTGDLAKNGYTFGGWSDGVNTYSAGDEIEDISDDITLTAVWTPNDYTITYHLNGASWASAAGVASYTVGTGATLPVAGDLSNVGYTFNGWYANSDLSTGGVKTSISTSDYGNKEFWAKWTEITYDVTYNANGGSGTTAAQNGHYVTLRDNGFTAPSGKIFAEWNTASDGSGASYNEGEEVELTADLALYAIWANDYTITWGNVQLGGAGATVKPNLGGGNYTITASVADWTGTLTTSMISAVTDGVVITNVAVDNSSSPKTITATFGVGASVVGTSITLELDVPAAGSYGANSSTKEIDIDRCTGSGGGSDGVLFSAEFKDSGLGTSNICDAANTPFTFTTDQLKAAAVGGSIKAYTTGNLGHMKYATNAISIAGTNGVIQIDLNSAIATNDLFTYVNVNGSSSSAYLRHTSADNTTDQIALTVYNSKEVKVRLTSGFNGKTTLYIVRNNNDFMLHKAAVIRPAFLMLLRDDTPTSTTDLSGTDVEMTTSTYLSTISGGRVYFTSPTSSNLKIYRSNSKNYIKFNNSAGYVKVVLNEALQEGDVIGFDSYNTNELAFTTTATRSTTIRSTGLLYTVNGTSALKGQTTFYIWNYSGSSDYLRGLQIARSGVAGGGGGSDQIATSLTWSGGLADGGLVTKDEGVADFTYSASTTSNTLGAITYTSSDAHVTVSSTGKMHIGSGIDFGGADYKDFTITANLAESGCYESASITYTLRVNNTCEDVAGTIGTEDLGCSGIRMTVTGQTTSGETVSYQWYKDGASIGGATSDTYTATAAGEYYVIVTNTGYGHCSKASTNTVVLEAQAAATATKIVDEWYVKNGRRTPDIALIQTENATGFIVKSGSTPIWNSDGSVTTGFAGCGFYLGEDGIIYLKGQKDDETEPAGLSAGDETLKFTASACGGNSSELSITIHKQAATSYKTVAFVVEGTKGGDWNVVTSGQADGSALYEYLDTVGTAASARKFALTECNIYKTNDEKTLRQYYSQFDAILITDNPNTKTVPSKGDDYTKKGYVNAIGSLIDIRPVLTMEAFVSALDNWKAKGINGNPSSPDPRQYGMKLDCKNHAIFKGINSSSTNVEVEDIDDVEYWTVIMVDSTMSPYSGVAYNVDTKDKPALQGFSASDVSELMLLGEISDGALYAGVERQEEPAARLLLLGLNHQALPSALTPEGKKIIENALSYLIETDMERVDDCSNYFTGATSTDWNTASNWSKELVPNSPYVKARILSPCVVNSGTYKVASIDIATSGRSINKAGTINGSLTINAGAALVVGGRVRSAEAPYFNRGDLMPTTVNDLVINTNSTNQAALVFNNDKGDTKATVNLYSLGRKESGAYQFQYLAVPMNYIDVNPAFAGSGIYTYVWHEASGWERRGYYTGLEAFEGVGITTKFEEAKTYTLQGALTSTTEKAITLSNETNGQNIVGNSWTAPINIASLRTALVDDDNIVDKTVYIYCTGNDKADDNEDVDYGTTETAGQWLAIPIEAAAWGAWGGLKVIPAMQAFCIKANTGTTLTLNYQDHVRSTASTELNRPLRAPKHEAEAEGIDLIRIRVADSKTHTDLYLFEGEQFTEAFDNGWEAKYMSGDGRSAKLYAETTIGLLAVAAQPEYEGTVLGFAPGQETEYTFTFSGPNTDYYLNDLKLKKSTLISEGESYLFTFEEGDTNRFYISRTRIDAPAVATGTENTADGVKARKVIVNDKLYIILNGRVYSAEGIIVK